MRTQRTVMLIVGGIVLAAIGVAVGLMWRLGLFVGAGAAVALATIVILVYVLGLRRWQLGWGTTERERELAMPGDDRLPGAGSSTRAITIDAPPELVWPWLVQIGYGKAGWYSYDWIDNDGRPSADRIVPAFQDLAVGDRIAMMPDMGPEVIEIMAPHHLLSGGPTDSWCLLLEPVGDHATRLISRWHEHWPRTAGTFFWLAISEPGAFIMERKMLLNLRRLAASDRVQAARR